ncbi:MAG: hypothetical protein ACR2LM_13530 [Pyrinomonadaceae bacterium]
MNAAFEMRCKGIFFLLWHTPERRIEVIWRDSAIALSLANLCFIGAWRWLLLPSYSFYYYHMKVPPSLAVYAALILDVLLLATLFLIGARIIRRSKSDLMRKCARLAFVLMLSVPIYGLLSQIDTPGVRRLVLTFVNDETVARKLLATIPLATALFLSLVALLKVGKAVRVGTVLILFLTPFVAVTFSQTAFMAMRYSQTGPRPSASPLTSERERDGPRVLWLVFDELDFRTAFSERPPTIRLVELDRLASESLSATNAFPPAQETFLSLPALTTGKLVSAARRVSPEELMIKFGDDAEAVPWSAQPNIFSRARGLGFDTALLGWYHPYCRILGSNLTKCAWEGRVPLASLKEGADPSHAAGWLLVAYNMYAYARGAVRTAPLFALLFPERVDIGDLARRKHLSNFNIIHRQALEAAMDSKLGLVMIHWPIPHPPNIYDRSEETISVAPGRSYLDNLKLVDRTIRDVRRVMEGKGIWENTVVLVTSDHWWRSSYWKNQSAWMTEDEAASGGETDRRVPFILKLAGEAEGATYTSPFNTVLTHDLLLAILSGEVSKAKDAALWLDRHRSIGRSPYDERSFRDGL